MDVTVIEAGKKYEKLLLRAYSYKYRQVTLSPKADRRLYYLLYYIRIGYDLRKTGYGVQYNIIRDNVAEALQIFLSFRLRADEKQILQNLLVKIKMVMNEKELGEVLTEALDITERFQI